MKYIYLICQVSFIPHILLFISSNKKEIILKDLYKKQKIKNGLSKELLTNKYFRISNIFSKLLRVIFPSHSSFTIEINSKIGACVHLAHPYSTIINAKSIIENLYINQVVTIGEKNGKKPVIGNNVEIHAHCVLIGRINIGDNSIIGAGPVVVKDVPKNCVVAGNPAKVIKYLESK
ncbi:serine O-acetyltransferase [Arcobacter roscoffensis]|uniref:serine O-acetyltransferase n=1 Tax=Arcobacter roscoffensis TaxID=2961520 RepID=UPI0024B79BA8|nr:hypothetical protein [Arcobacter roscoffensis]